MTKQKTKKLIDDAYKEALKKIDKVKQNVDLKVSNRKSSQEQKQIDAILDKINSEF